MRALAVGVGARIVLTMAETQVLPAVTDACERAAVPCVSTTFPWPCWRRPAGPRARRRGGRGPHGDAGAGWLYQPCGGRRR
ncbi:hypothetical protein ACZ91_43155 [Streptomyces regensis]|nr:hypothetical protein ACZ91_43155 [Streptomyces regensis]